MTLTATPFVSETSHGAWPDAATLQRLVGRPQDAAAAGSNSSDAERIEQLESEMAEWKEQLENMPQAVKDSLRDDISENKFGVSGEHSVAIMRKTLAYKVDTKCFFLFDYEVGAGGERKIICDAGSPLTKDMLASLFFDSQMSSNDSKKIERRNLCDDKVFISARVLSEPKKQALGDPQSKIYKDFEMLRIRQQTMVKNSQCMLKTINFASRALQPLGYFWSKMRMMGTLWISQCTSLLNYKKFKVFCIRVFTLALILCISWEWIAASWSDSETICIWQDLLGIVRCVCSGLTVIPFGWRWTLQRWTRSQETSFADRKNWRLDLALGLRDPLPARSVRLLRALLVQTLRSEVRELLSLHVTKLLRRLERVRADRQPLLDLPLHQRLDRLRLLREKTPKRRSEGKSFARLFFFYSLPSGFVFVSACYAAMAAIDSYGFVGVYSFASHTASTETGVPSYRGSVGSGFIDTSVRCPSGCGTSGAPPALPSHDRCPRLMSFPL